MRRFIYIPILVAALLSMSSCENRELDYPTNDEWAPHYGYMQFSTDVFDGVSTRAQLVENMRGRSFGVLGYQYSSTTNWGAAKALATPSVFYNQKVTCDESGVCTYDTDNNEENGNQLKLWESNLYTFFAYQPYNGAGITLSGKSAVNTPTLTYTYGWLDGVANSATTPITAYNNPNIFDLMTAEDINVSSTSGNTPGKVNFEFNHRLFAIEIQANNFNENAYKCYYYRYVYYVVDEDGDVVLDADGNPTIAEWSAEPTDDMIIAVDDENNIIYETETVTVDGTSVTRRKEYSHDEGGGDVVARDANGNTKYQLDENDNPIFVPDEPVYKYNADGTLSTTQATYSDGTPMLKLSNQSQTMTDLKINIKGLANSTMTIPLSMQPGEAAPTYTTVADGIGGTTGVTFQVSNQEVTVPAFNETITDEDDGTVRGEGVASSISKLGSANSDGYLMFIPQTSGLEFEFDWDELPKLQEYYQTVTPPTTEGGVPTLTTSLKSDVEFQPGYLYQIIINFVGDGITIAIIEAGQWTIHDVYHTFE